MVLLMLLLSGVRNDWALVLSNLGEVIIMFALAFSFVKLQMVKNEPKRAITV